MTAKALFAAALIFCISTSVYAVYSVSDEGRWPSDWPKELEPLRKHARTLVGPMAPNRHFVLPFKDRDEFEAAWPHLVSVKTKGAPIFLRRRPNYFLGEENKAGVVIHCPPEGQAKNRAAPETPMSGVTNPRSRWMNANYLELVVDGDVVDLNRIALPSDTPIVDERFKITSKK